MTVTLALKKDPGCIFCSLIKWWTKSPYYHVEMIIGDKWISSNSDMGGVTIRDLQPKHENWDYVEVDIDGRKLSKVWTFIESQQDKSYDWKGIILAQIMKIDRADDQDKWFCSEIVTEILKVFGEEKVKHIDSASIDPGELYEMYT